jgi:transposase
LVERLFSKVEHFLRVATGHDRLAASDLAFIQLASIEAWLRVHESAP